EPAPCRVTASNASGNLSLRLSTSHSTGTAAHAPRVARPPSSVMNSRRFTRSPRRHLEADRLCGLDVDGQLEFGRLEHRQVGRPLTLKNAADIGAHLTERVHRTGVVAH